MTAVRFQADADLNQAIVTGTVRRQPNLDFRSAYAAELEGKKAKNWNQSILFSNWCESDRQFYTRSKLKRDRVFIGSLNGDRLMLSPELLRKCDR